MENRAASRRRAVALLATAVGVLTVPVVAVVLIRSAHYREQWDSTWARPVLVSHLAATAAMCWGGVVMLRRRPSNACGVVAVLLGTVFGAWYCTFFISPIGWWSFANSTLVYTFRPLMFFLVLAFPFGRLDRSGRRVLLAIVAGSAAVYLIDLGQRAELRHSPFELWEPARWTLLATSAWWDVFALVAAIAALVVVQRRRLHFRGAEAVRFTRPAILAALVAVGGDVVLVATGPLRDVMTHSGQLTWFAMSVQVVDLTRFGLVVLILAVGASRTWVGIDDEPVIELGAARSDGLRGALRQALGDPAADVAVADRAGGWLDGAGRARGAPDPARATLLVDGGMTVAAFEFEEALRAHPAVVDAAVTAVALQVDAARETALAQQHERDLRRLGLELIEAEDPARARLEADLHDGSQQELVALTLDAALAARQGTSIAELADQVDRTGAALAATASGRPPALLARRGLDGALAALAGTAGIPTTVQIARCDDLPDPVVRAIWFTASEAMGNALKHSGAVVLKLTLERTDGVVSLQVDDNGRGGVATVPRSIAARAQDVDGQVTLRSDGRGTRISVVVPITAEVSS